MRALLPLLFVTPIIGLLLPCTSREARADAKGEKVLALADKALTRAEDQTMRFEMIVDDPGKEPRRLLMEVHVRGTKKRRVRFLAPGDVKGMALLTLARTQMYVYLPAYRKIRRIASHARSQTMFGSDYNYDDMSTVTYSGVYQPRLEKETATHWTVVATRRPGQESPYARLRLRIRKKDHLPDLIEHFNAEGKKIKTDTRSAFTCEKEVCGASVMKMVDHTRNGHWTKLVRKTWAVNTGFSDNIFSLRRLQKGR